MPRVSVIMRTKDRDVLLRRALSDVARQTFTDWGLVIVNDGGAASWWTTHWPSRVSTRRRCR